MPKLGDIPPEIALTSGESVSVDFDTASDVAVIHGEQGTRYAFIVKLADGRMSVLKGGKRLLSAIQTAVGSYNGTIRLKVRAEGKAGTFDRTWFAEKV